MRNLQAPDRISALPEPIIHRILSRLPTKSVKLATSLSKTWYDFCSSFPCLDFDNSFESDAEESLDYDLTESDFDPNLKPLRERYLNYIGETLRRFHECNPRILIRRLRIPITLINSSFASILYDWIRLALEHGVEKIDLKCWGYCFNLPGEVFTSNSIRVLKLVGCSFHGDLSVASFKLRKLVINGVYTDELALRSVISSCPLMEKLAIQDAMGLTHLRISRHYNLKSLVVNNFSNGIEIVEVDTPLLHCLKLRNFNQCHCKFGILECPRLAKLTLYNVEVDNFQLEEILSRLPFLSSLRLTGSLLLTKFKISNDSLNKLEIISCTHLEELEIDAPNLLSFEFECKLVPLMVPMHTIMGQSYITITVIGLEPSLYDNFGVKLGNFLSRLHCVTYLSLQLEDFAMISVDEPEERVVQPVIDIEELKIIVQMPNNLQDIFNGLLRSFHPRILIMQLVFFEKSDVVKFLRDIMVSGGPCCSWLPYLEEMTIVAGNEDVIRLPLDGTVPSIGLESYLLAKIKFVFKWISYGDCSRKDSFLRHD